MGVGPCTLQITPGGLSVTAWNGKAAVNNHAAQIQVLFILKKNPQQFKSRVSDDGLSQHTLEQGVTNLFVEAIPSLVKAELLYPDSIYHNVTKLPKVKKKP